MENTKIKITYKKLTIIVSNTDSETKINIYV